MDNAVINYYNTYDEDGRLFRNNNHQIEWLTTMPYFNDIIPAHSKIFDGCAGTGNDAFKLAEQGHSVVAIKGVFRYIRYKLSATGRCTRADARDLSSLEAV